MSGSRKPMRRNSSGGQALTTVISQSSYLRDKSPKPEPMGELIPFSSCFSAWCLTAELIPWNWTSHYSSWMTGWGRGQLQEILHLMQIWGLWLIKGIGKDWHSRLANQYGRAGCCSKQPRTDTVPGLRELPAARKKQENCHFCYIKRRSIWGIKSRVLWEQTEDYLTKSQGACGNRFPNSINGDIYCYLVKQSPNVSDGRQWEFFVHLGQISWLFPPKVSQGPRWLSCCDHTNLELQGCPCVTQLV